MPAPENVAIRVENLTKKFGSQTIWENLNFDIPKGEISVILGPSGTGKSVLLKHFVGLLKPTEGHVWVGDKDIPALNEKELFEVRKKFGVLFQDGALFGSMTLKDNVAFPLREHTDLSEGTIRQIVLEKLELVGLKGAEDKYPGEISGGMKKRAGLARALVLEPEILLFDEPDSGLDPVRTAFLNLLTVDLKQRLGPTIIVVTHHIQTATTLPDHIGLIFARQLVDFDTRERMVNSKELVVRQFLTGSTIGPIGMSEEKDAAERAHEMAADDDDIDDLEDLAVTMVHDELPAQKPKKKSAPKKKTSTRAKSSTKSTARKKSAKRKPGSRS